MSFSSRTNASHKRTQSKHTLRTNMSVFPLESYGADCIVQNSRQNAIAQRFARIWLMSDPFWICVSVLEIFSMNVSHALSSSNVDIIVAAGVALCPCILT